MKRPLSRAASFAAATLAAASLGVVAGLAGGSAAAAATAPATTTEPAAAAAGWLAQQLMDGSHQPSPAGDHFDGSFFDGSSTVYFFDGGRTADAIFALAASKSGKDKIDAAAGYLAAHLDEYADLSEAQGGPYDGSLGKAALAAIVAGADPTDFGGHNLLQVLKDDECTAEPNASCLGAGAARNIFSSVAESFVILAEARAGGAYRPSADAEKYFLGLQCADGGFDDNINAAGCTSGLDETSYGAMALQALGGHGTQLAEAVAWLKSKRSADGRSWADGNGANEDSTGLAAAVLGAAGEDVSAARAWLASRQITRGPTVGPGATRGAVPFQSTTQPSDWVKSTADGLLGLVSGVTLANVTAAGAQSGTAVLAPTSTAASRSVPLGGAQTVSAVGFAAGETVTGVLHSAPVDLGSVKADASGTATLRFTVPSALATGAHDVVLTGATSGLSASVTFEVTRQAVAPQAVTAPTSSTTTPSAAPVTPAVGSGPQLAASGLDRDAALRQTLAGVGLVLAGAAAVYAGRRRRA